MDYQNGSNSKREHSQQSRDSQSKPQCVAIDTKSDCFVLIPASSIAGQGLQTSSFLKVQTVSGLANNKRAERGKNGGCGGSKSSGRGPGSNRGQNLDLAVEQSFDVSNFNPQAMFKEMHNFRMNSQQRSKRSNKSSEKIKHARNHASQDTYLLSTSSHKSAKKKKNKEKTAKQTDPSEKHKQIEQNQSPTSSQNQNVTVSLQRPKNSENHIQSLMRHRKEKQERLKKSQGKRMLNPWQFSFSVSNRGTGDAVSIMQSSSQHNSAIVEETASTVRVPDSEASSIRCAYNTKRRAKPPGAQGSLMNSTTSAGLDELHKPPSSTEDLESACSNGILSNKDIGEVILPRSPCNDYAEVRVPSLPQTQQRAQPAPLNLQLDRPAVNTRRRIILQQRKRTAQTTPIGVNPQRMPRQHNEMKNSVQGRLYKGETNHLLKSTDARNQVVSLPAQFKQNAKHQNQSVAQTDTNRLQQASKEVLDTEFLSNRSTMRLEASKDHINEESSMMLMPMIDEQLKSAPLEMRDRFGNEISSSRGPMQKHVLASQPCFNVYEKKGNFLIHLYREVMFRKQNDFGYEHIVKHQRGGAQSASSKPTSRPERHRILRSTSMIGELIGNQNEGEIIHKANQSAFFMRRKTHEIENVKMSRLESLRRHQNEASALGYDELLSSNEQYGARPSTMQYNTRLDKSQDRLSAFTRPSLQQENNKYTQKCQKSKAIMPASRFNGKNRLMIVEDPETLQSSVTAMETYNKKQTLSQQNQRHTSEQTAVTTSENMSPSEQYEAQTSSAFLNPPISKLSDFNYKCPLDQEMSNLSLKRRKLLSQKQYRERMKHQVQDSMRRRRLNRISAKREKQHIDLKEWMKGNSKVRISDLARPVFHFEHRSDNFTLRSEDMACSSSDNDFHLSGLVTSPLIDIKTGLRGTIH